MNRSLLLARRDRLPTRVSLARRARTAACRVATIFGVFGAFAVIGLLAAPGAASDPDPVLVFVRANAPDLRIASSALDLACPISEVEVDDPYHERRMRYSAWSLRCVLDQGFAAVGGAQWLRGQGVLLRARDGYTRPVSGADLLDPGGYLAFGEPGLESDGRPRFSLLDRRRVDPGPFYLVWSGIAQNDPHETPWPFQLATIEVAPFREAFPRTVPKGLAEGDPGWVGYALFQESCSACHSINGEGGKVGPELNVPRSIVEYRPVDQIKAYVRNPQATRYTSMPAHPGLDEADLDALIAYFRAMSARKQDVRAGADS